MILKSLFAVSHFDFGVQSKEKRISLSLHDMKISLNLKFLRNFNTRNTQKHTVCLFYAAPHVSVRMPHPVIRI